MKMTTSRTSVEQIVGEYTSYDEPSSPPVADLKLFADNNGELLGIPFRWTLSLDGQVVVAEFDSTNRAANLFTRLNIKGPHDKPACLFVVGDSGILSIISKDQWNSRVILVRYVKF